MCTCHNRESRLPGSTFAALTAVNNKFAPLEASYACASVAITMRYGSCMLRGVSVKELKNLFKKYAKKLDKGGANVVTLQSKVYKI
jgi:hypothetical protein